MNEMKPWWKSWPVLAVAGVLVVLALGGGGMILGSRLGGAGKEPVPASSAPGGGEAAPASPSAGGEGSVCGLTAREDKVGKLATEAPKTEWESLGNALVTKKNETHGPGVVEEDGFRYCYARTPEGALYSITNAATLMGSSPDIAKKAIDTYVVDGDAKQKMLQVAESPSSNSGPADIRGYRYDAYNGTTATVTLLLQKAGNFGAVTADATWSNGTWQIKPAGDGHIVYNRQAVQNEAGFVLWGLSHG